MTHRILQITKEWHCPILFPVPVELVLFPSMRTALELVLFPFVEWKPTQFQLVLFHVPFKLVLFLSTEIGIGTVAGRLLQGQPPLGCPWSACRP